MKDMFKVMEANPLKYRKDWAWYVFLLGMPVDELAVRLKCTRNDVISQVVDAHIEGRREYVDRGRPALPNIINNPWTKRQDKILLRLKAEGVSLSRAAALLERYPEHTKARYIHLSRHAS